MVVRKGVRCAEAKRWVRVKGLRRIRGRMALCSMAHLIALTCSPSPPELELYPHSKANR